MKHVTIRLMQEADIPAVAQVFLASFNSIGEHWAPETAHGHVAENFSEDSCFVACHEDEIVGIALASLATREKGVELFIDAIAVLPGYQRQTTGTQLWQQLHSYAEEQQYVGIRLLSDKQLPSFSWYKDMGFKESGWVEVFREF